MTIWMSTTSAMVTGILYSLAIASKYELTAFRYPYESSATHSTSAGDSAKTTVTMPQCHRHIHRALRCEQPYTQTP